jgi:hypothetical protein
MTTEGENHLATLHHICTCQNVHAVTQMHTEMLCALQAVIGVI